MNNNEASPAAQQLRDHLNSLDIGPIDFQQAAGLGVELVYDQRSDGYPMFFTAAGDQVVLHNETGQWEAIGQSRPGIPVQSGQMLRTHQPYTHYTARIADTATVHPAATIEPGATVGPHAYVGPDAHIGRDTTIASYVRVEPGAYIGAYSSIQDGSRVGPGAVIGSGSRVGPTTNIGAGARVEQHSHIAAFDNIAAHSRTGSTNPTHQRNASHAGHEVARMIDRLAALDRD